MFFDNWLGLVRIVVVGVLAYLALVILLRVSGKRTLSKMNAFDFVVTVALGSTLATILLSETVALFEGVVAFILLISLQFVITWLSVRSPAVRRLSKSEPALLFHNGNVLDGAMRRERVVRAELLAAIREQGKSSLDEVASVVLETDGSFSILSSSPQGDARSTLKNVRGAPRMGEKG